MIEKLGIDVLHDEIALLRKRLAKATALLKRIENRDDCCPSCGLEWQGDKGRNYERDCELAAFLKGL